MQQETAESAQCHWLNVRFCLLRVAGRRDAVSRSAHNVGTWWSTRLRGPPLTWNPGTPHMFIFRRSPIPPLVGIIIILSGVLLTHQRDPSVRRLPETPCTAPPTFPGESLARMRDFARLQRQAGQSEDWWEVGRL